MRFNGIKVCHEIPKCLFEESRKFNDYSYYLDYLWDDEVYRNFFREELRRGRTVILDSSLFEFHPIVPPIDRFYEHVCDLVGHGGMGEYIVVDVLNKADDTIEKFEEWKKNYSDAPGKSIGVVQGNTVAELDRCYKYMSQNAEKIAIPFDSFGFNELTQDVTLDSSTCDRQKQLKAWALGRRRYIEHLVHTGLWNPDKPHHLLGCSFAWEFAFPLYRKISIETLDTSNPIVTGINGIPYTSIGNPEKPSMKLCDLIDYEVSDSELKVIEHNIARFKELTTDVIHEEDL